MILLNWYHSWVTCRYQRSVLCWVVVSPAWLLYPLFGFCIPFSALVFVSLFALFSPLDGELKSLLPGQEVSSTLLATAKAGMCGCVFFQGGWLFKADQQEVTYFSGKGGVPYFDRHINPTSMPILLTSFPRG